MTNQEAKNGSEDMVIDGFEPDDPAVGQYNSVPDGFNINYLKVYYGKCLYFGE